MILEIDMGNTRLKWRLRNESVSVARGCMQADGDVSLLNEILDQFSQPITHVWIASVMDDMRNQAVAYFILKKLAIAPQFARATHEHMGVKNGYREPERLGVDRWLAALAAYQLIRGPCVVVDCGSAMTVDLIDSQGMHLGGYIAPGEAMMRSSLAVKTHGVQVAESTIVRSVAPGRDTESAVSAAQAAMAIGLVRQAVRELTVDGAAPQLVLTGGDAAWLKPMYPDALIVVDLVLDGLALVFA